MAERLSVFDAEAAITLGVVNVVSEVQGNQLVLTNLLASEGESQIERIPIRADSVSVADLQRALQRMGARY